ncbi:hypothetical protein [Angelakisella massiliensis]|uniref:hypothetical protein n=1 Tax=Angelakisella massiliensis TaxID=1871018 RepID=UPI00111348F2|nr:hypothetical protein [Angelakisella massiliensis]
MKQKKKYILFLSWGQLAAPEVLTMCFFSYNGRTSLFAHPNTFSQAHYSYEKSKTTAKGMERKTIIQKCLFLGVDFKTKIE